MPYTNNQGSVQPAHLRSLIRIFINRLQKQRILSNLSKNREGLHPAHAQADLGIRCSHYGRKPFFNAETP